MCFFLSVTLKFLLEVINNGRIFQAFHIAQFESSAFVLS